MEEDKTTSIYIDKDCKDQLEQLARDDQRSLVDELRWLIRMERMRRAVDAAAEAHLND